MLPTISGNQASLVYQKWNLFHSVFLPHIQPCLYFSKGEKCNTLALKHCGITVNDQLLYSFKMNGIRIVNNLKDGTVPWTLCGYAIGAKKSVENLKIGVGCITNTRRASQGEVH